MQGWNVRGLRLLAAMVGFVFGTALQLRQPALWQEAVYAGLVGGAVAVWWALQPLERVRHGALVLPMAVLAGAMAGGGLAGWRAASFAAEALPESLEGGDLIVTGVVAKMPLRSENGLRFTFEVESARWLDEADDDRAPPRVPPRISLGWYADAAGETHAPLHAGERWRLPVRLKAPHGSLNPHGFDYELRLWEQGEHATGYVRMSGLRGALPERIAATWSYPIERTREAVRDSILDRVADRRSAGVIAALVTGDQNAIERADWDVFRATGVAHLMAISGLHVTMFAWLAALAVEALWRRSRSLMLRWPAQHAGLAGGVALAALYAAFSGWGVPSQRTVWMLAVVGLLRLGGRLWPWPVVWLLACAVVVAIDPWALTQPGFWLSFVAVGVLFAAGNDPAEAPAGVAARLIRLLREQWVVTLALTPLTLLLFQQISIVGLPANLVAIPWVTLVVTPLSMLGVLLPFSWDLASWALQALSWALQWLAAWPFATLSMPAPPLWMAIAGVVGGILVAMRLPWSVRVLGLPLLMPALLWLPPRPAAGEFELLAVDVGQGNAVLVRTAGHGLLYDAGPRYSLDSDAGHRVLVPLLRAFGERLDTVVLSHRDSDHTGGAAAVLAMQPHAKLLSSIEASHPLQALRAADRCVAGQRWQWDGVDFEILHPAEGDYMSFTKPNAVSCVLRVSNGRATALLAGDIERLQEYALVERHADLSADLLLVPHHGSKTSSSPLLLDAVRPGIAIAQAGWRNRFGHPAAEVVQRYADHGIRLVDSPHCGAASWSSVTPGDLLCHRNAARRYWHHQMN